MRTVESNCALIVILVIASIVTVSISLLSPSSVRASLTSHAPIYINGNSGFTKPDPVNGGGSGTESDPYIIENWVINASSADGIWIENTTACFIVRNCLVENGVDGIRLSNVDNGKIENSSLNNNDYGIRCESSSRNNLTYNSLNYNSSGVYLSYSDNENLVNNTYDTNYYGISVYYSSNETIIWNSCLNNAVGMYLSGSNNNYIYHNNLVNNGDQAIDDGSNFWDNGYPSGGNYWDDYTGADNYHGENQNIPGGEGIGDTSYEILDGSNLDRYPLMNPWPCVIENYPSFDRNLVTGWNLVCFTAVGASDTPTNLFTGLTYYTDYYLYWWTAPGGPYNIQDPDTVVLDNIAYWVYINTSKTVSMTGTPPASRNIYNVTGWNMVGFPVVNEGTTPDNKFAPLNYYTDYYLFWWTAPGGPYNIQDPNTAFQDNLGYWAWINQDLTITVP